MTSAQKLAKEKFKKAIAYRQKSGVSLKEAFAHVYGKKKVARKKVAKKRISGPKDSKLIKKELARKGLKMPHGYTTTKRKRKISGIKKKKITEKGILNKIHIVKHNVDKLDEAQHTHMLGGIGKHMIHEIGEAYNKLKKYEIHLQVLKGNKPKIVKSQIPYLMKEIKKTIEAIKEQKIHIAQLKKHI